MHVDLKANASMHMALVQHAKGLPNVHVLKTRRLVQWGGAAWSGLGPGVGLGLGLGLGKG